MVEGVKGMETTDLTPNGLSVVDGLYAPSAQPAAIDGNVSVAVNDAFTPNAADVVDALLRRPSMAIAGERPGQTRTQSPPIHHSARPLLTPAGSPFVIQAPSRR